MARAHHRRVRERRRRDRRKRRPGHGRSGSRRPRRHRLGARIGYRIRRRRRRPARSADRLHRDARRRRRHRATVIRGCRRATERRAWRRTDHASVRACRDRDRPGAARSRVMAGGGRGLRGRPCRRHAPPVEGCIGYDALFGQKARHTSAARSRRSSADCSGASI